MEAMAAESIVASAWELDGFLTKVRWALRTERGNYSDIDAIGVNATSAVRVAECKVPWGPRMVKVVDEASAVRFASEYPARWTTSLSNLERLWAEPPPWVPSPRDVSSLEFWLCANVWFASERARKIAENHLYGEARQACPNWLKGKLSVEVHTTLDVLTRVIQGVRCAVLDERRGRRFGNPLLDAIRELIRYTHPAPSGGGRVARQIRVESTAALISALDLEAVG